MNRLGIVPQRLLCEPLRESAFQRPLRPSVPIRVQRQARNLQPIASLFEFRCSIPCPHRAEIRKKRTDPWTPFQNVFNVCTESKKRWLEIDATCFEFFARETNRARAPVDVFGSQASAIRLRRAGVPEQFVKIPPLWIQFAGNNFRVFFGSDRPI